MLPFINRGKDLGGTLFYDAIHYVVIFHSGLLVEVAMGYNIMCIFFNLGVISDCRDIY